METQLLPPSSVRAIVRQGAPEHFAIPRTKPTDGETKVADSGSKSDGRGVPTGAVIAGAVVVVVVEVVVVGDACVVDVVVVGDALLVEEVRVNPIATAAIITAAEIADVIATFSFLLMAFLHNSPY